MIRNPTASTVVFTLYILAWLFMVYSCLEGEDGIDRLTWIIVILGIPIFGLIFYGVNYFRRAAKE